uniref:Oxidoreductase-like domain-containing protein n=1 Tax=Ditylenchus dipsaci TaxID=166011 RepID=A0A915EUI9_9BILA
MLMAFLRAHLQISRSRCVFCKQTLAETDQHLSINEDARNDLIKFPEAPDPSTCCATGCPNCVWVQYADDVMKYYSKNRSAHYSLSAEQQLELIREQIDRHIQDVNLRAYLWMELRAKKFN